MGILFGCGGLGLGVEVLKVKGVKLGGVRISVYRNKRVAGIFMGPFFFDCGDDYYLSLALTLGRGTENFQ